MGSWVPWTALAGLIVVVALVGGCSSGSGHVPPSVRQDITPSQLEAMMNDGQPLVILDVRTVSEYEDGRIPGSVNIPLGELPARLGELAEDARTVCVCSGGVRSVSGAQVLLDNGFTRVYNLQGGLQNWHGAWEPTGSANRFALLWGWIRGYLQGPRGPGGAAVA